jgi:hypothetical protein
MSQRTTEQLVADIKQNEQIAATQLEAKPAATRTAFQLAVADAKNALRGLKADYRRRILINAVGFVVSGPKVAEFVATAKAVAPQIITLDAEKFWNDLAERIEPSFGASREFTVHQLGVLIQALREAALDAGVQADLPMPQLRDQLALPTRADVVSFLRDVVGPVGEVLNSTALSNQLVDQALASDFTGTVLVAMVVNADNTSERELGAVFANRFEVATDVDTEVTEEFVTKVFDASKKKNKKQK